MDSKCFQALHHLLIPAQFAVEELDDNMEMRRMGRSGNKKKSKKAKKTDQEKKAKPNHPTTQDSKNSTLLICDYGQNVKEQVQALAERQKKKKIEFCPIMAISLDKFKKPAKFYVFCSDIFWEVESFIQCIDVYIKTFFVFDVAYPKEGEKCCKFLIGLFFNFETDDGKVGTLINDIKTLAKKDGEN